jgi:hypothetical protein
MRSNYILESLQIQSMIIAKKLLIAVSTKQSHQLHTPFFLIITRNTHKETSGQHQGRSIAGTEILEFYVAQPKDHLT